MSKKKIILWLILIFSVFILPSKSQGKTNDFLRKKYDPIIRAISAKHGVDPGLVHSVISAESNYNRYAVSGKGALGLMQLIPETAKDYGVNDVFAVEENIEGGVKYLKDLIKLYKRKTDLVLAAYNAGQEAVKKYGKIPPYPETKAYIRRVMASYKNSKAEDKSRIFTFYDKEGKLVLTNDIIYYAQNKGSLD